MYNVVLTISHIISDTIHTGQKILQGEKRMVATSFPEIEYPKMCTAKANLPAYVIISHRTYLH